MFVPLILLANLILIGPCLSIPLEDEDFKYPTTPYPDPDGTTIPFDPDLIAETENQNFGNIKGVTGPIVTGNKTCECGVSPKHKIVGGEDARISDLPWTAALIRKRGEGQQVKGPYCGGTLISTRYVLTAAHCVDGADASKIQVWLNEEDFRVENETDAKTMRIDVEEIIIHEKYDPIKIDNDIALLRLSEDVDIEKGIAPACIPADNSESYEGSTAIVAGWGAKEQGGPVSSTLQKVSVPVITNVRCNLGTLYIGKITDNQLCAGEIASGGKDSCQGDSGGPLVVKRDSDQYIIAGVVSYGYGCARPLAPGVYTRVSRYPEWIVEKSKDADYCSR